jgi:hypothetical protein
MSRRRRRRSFEVLRTRIAVIDSRGSEIDRPESTENREQAGDAGPLCDVSAPAAASVTAGFDFRRDGGRFVEQPHYPDLDSADLLILEPGFYGQMWAVSFRIIGSRFAAVWLTAC